MQANGSWTSACRARKANYPAGGWIGYTGTGLVEDETLEGESSTFEDGIK